VTFIVSGWIATLVRFWPTVLPIAGIERAGLFATGVYIISLFFAIILFEQDTVRIAPIWGNYIRLVVSVLVLLTLYGLWKGNAFRVVIFDLMAYFTVFAGFILGRREEVWKTIRPWVFALTVLSIFGAISYTDSAILRDRSLISESAGANFESALVLAPLLCMFSLFDRRPAWYYLFLLVCAGSFFVYLYFGRRSTSARGLIELLAAAAVFPLIVGRKRQGLWATAVSLVFLLGLWVSFPFDTIVTRFLGTYGFVGTNIGENERWQEVEMLFSELSPAEVLVGRGMGGAYAENRADTSAIDQVSETSYGRIGVHLGIVSPMLKGGLVWWSVYFAPLFILLMRSRECHPGDNTTKAAIACGFILFAFLFIEGATSYSVPWTGFCYGLIIARIQNLQAGIMQQTGTRVPARRNAQAHFTFGRRRL